MKRTRLLRMSPKRRREQAIYDQRASEFLWVGRRFWQSNPSGGNAHAFHMRVVKPLRQLQRRGVVERLQEFAATEAERSRQREPLQN
jgi:hypothetical protein